VTARRTSAAVPFTAEQMFSLVADVERYPEFLPWCAGLRIVSRRADDSCEIVTADMIVAYKVFREQFRSLVRLDRDRLRIEVDYVDGPFRSLKNEWAFQDRSEGGSIVDFAIEFEFRSFLLQHAAHSVFEKAFLRMSEAFVERANAVYRR